MLAWEQVLMIVAARRSGRKSKTTLESLRWLACHQIELWAWRATAREVLKSGSTCEGFAGLRSPEGLRANR